MGLSQRRTRLVQRLRTRKTREREGLVLVEGIRAVEDALSAGARARFVVISPRLESLAGGPALGREIRARGLEIEEAPDEVLAGLADTEQPQGILMVCAEADAPRPFVAPAGRYLVLDGVQDPGNVGTLVRAAIAFALDGVMVLDGSADPWGAKAVRAAAGMTFRMPILKVVAPEALELLTAACIPLLVADSAGMDVAEVPAKPGWALVVGNEGAGPRRALTAAAPHTVRIPMPGPAESLNAGVAGAILLYVLTREETVVR